MSAPRWNERGSWPKAPRPRSTVDMVIDATAVAHALAVATANERHFADIDVPWINPAA